MVTVTRLSPARSPTTNNDGVKEITVAAIRAQRLLHVHWSVTDAPMDGVIDRCPDRHRLLRDGSGLDGGALPITFTAPVFDLTAQTCTTTPDPVVARTTTASTSPEPRTRGVKGKEWPRSPRTWPGRPDTG